MNNDLPAASQSKNDRLFAAADHITVLRTHPNRRATKLIRPGADGLPVLDGYDCGKWFAVDELEVSCLATLATALDCLSLDPRSLVIRGEPLPDIDRTRTRRLKHQAVKPTGEVVEPTFRDVPRQWLIIDLDEVPGPYRFHPLDGVLAGYCCRSLLPPAFQSAAFWWQLTSGAGFKPGVRLRLGFWLDRPVTGEEAGGWLAEAPVDGSVFGTVQPIYVARPVFVDVPNPVGRRSGVELDRDDAVAVPAEIPAKKPRATLLDFNAAGIVPRTVVAATDGTAAERLAALAEAVARTPPAGTNRWGGPGRHHALFCAALSASYAVRHGWLSKHDVCVALSAAARCAGLDDAREIARTIGNGLAQGDAA